MALPDMPDPAAARLQLAGAPMVQWRGRQAVLVAVDALLLAWLAVEGPTTRSRVAELLYPDSSVAAARNALRQRLYKLRQHVGADLVTGRETLALAAAVVHDLADADRLLAGVAIDAGGDLAVWLEQQRAGRRARGREALVERAAAAEQAGDWAAAIARGSELLALEPLSEAAHRRLMRLHYLAGDRAAAMLAFDRCEQVLKDEVGASPSAETLVLLQTIERAREVAPPAGRGVPAAVLRPPRLVGRGDAWRALEEAWAAQRPVLLSGEAGLGKTRLAGDFAAAHGALMAGARPGDERIAYASFSRLLRALPRERLAAAPEPLQRELARLLPELGDAAPPLRDSTDRTRFFNAVSQVFAGVAVVFDDLHFADDASVELLQYAVAAAPGRWLVAARGAEAPPAAARLLQEWAGASDVVRVPLAPLTLAQAAELLDSLALPGLDAATAAPALLRRSGGNPLFLLEVLKAGTAPAGPPALPGVHALIERRITRLSPPAVQLARCAAVAMPDFSIELAAHVLALRTIDLADPWAELEAAQVLVDGAFAHDLIFEAALASVPAAVARQLHAEIAAFLSTRQGEPVRLAGHWAQAGRWAEAAAAWRDAAGRSRAAGRTLDAAALLAQAAQAFERCAATDERFDVLMQRAWLLAVDHHGSDAQAAVADVLQLAASDEQRLQALAVKVELALHRHDDAAAVTDGRVALAMARALGRHEQALRLSLSLAGALGNTHRAAEAVALLEPQADWVREHAAPELQWGYWSGLGLALDYANRLREALPAWHTARDVAQRAGRNDLLWKTLANAASTLAKTGFVRRAAEQTAQACALAEAIGERTLRALQTRATWGHRLRDSGRYAEALAVLESALAEFTAQGSPADCAGAEHRLALLYQQLGQPQRAVPLLAEERAGLSGGLQMMRLVHRADIAHELGRDGLTPMREALALIDNPDDIYHRIASLFATRLVPPDEGEALATSLAAWASARERLGVALAAHVRAAACALRQGAAARAKPHADAALHLAVERQPDSFYLPEAWLVAGQVEAALGNPVLAAVHWRTGAAWVQQQAQVPPAYRDSFRARQPVNRELLRHAAAAG